MTVITHANSPYKVSAGSFDTGDVVFSGGTMLVLSGGVAEGTTVSSGGFLAISKGGTGGSGMITGKESVLGIDLDTTILQGGTATISSGGTEVSATTSVGGVLDLLHAGVVSGDIITNSGTLKATASGATVVGGEIDNTGEVAALGTSASLVLSGASVVIPEQIIVIVSGGTGGSSSSGGTGPENPGLVVASGGGAHVDLDNSEIIDQILTTSGGNAMIDTLAGTQNELAVDTLTSGTIVKVNNFSELTLKSVISNSGTISVGATSAFTYLDIYGHVTLTGGGKVQLSPSGNSYIEPTTANDTLTNVNNTIAGAGYLDDGNPNLTFINSGTVDATGALTLATGSTSASNAGVLEATGSGTLKLVGETVSNSPTGIIVASGAHAKVVLDNATVDGGTLETWPGGAAMVTASASSNTISGATIVGGSLVEAMSGGTMFLIDTTIDSGATVETASGGTAVLAATVNSGTIFASGAHSVITFFGPVNGGVTEVGNGTAAVTGGEAVTFQSGGTGELQLFDDGFNSQAYSGRISKFGQNTHQTIDLVNVASSAVVTRTYTPANAANTSGTLTVSSGSTVVAVIDFVGHYVTANFKLGKDSDGDLTIVELRLK